MSRAGGADRPNGALPNERWPIVPLERVLRYRKEFIIINDFDIYKRCRVQLHAQGIVLRDKVPGSEIKTKHQQVCRAGEFLVAEIDAKVGGFGIVPEELDFAIVSSHYFLFEIDSETLDRHFLDHYIRTSAFREQVSAQGSTNYAAIRPRDVLGYTIPLPPLAEQRRLVEHIDALTPKIVEATRLRHLADEETSAIQASLLNWFFSGPRVKSWPLRALVELANIQSGVTLGRTLTGPTLRLPYLRVANVQDAHFDLRTIKDVEIREDEREKWQLLPGDVLLTEGGDWDKLGRGAVWRGEIPNCIHQNHIFRVRVDQTILDPDFLAVVTGSPYGKSYFQGASKQTTNLASINQRQLKAFPVFLPPLEDQRTIIAFMHTLRKRIEVTRELQSHSLRELDSMLPTILDKAFNGGL